MNLDALQQKLLAAARAHPPSDRVPYAFEQRILARLAASAVDTWTLWGQALWRAAATCLVIMLLSSIWTLWPRPSSQAQTDFYQQFESAVLAHVDTVDDGYWQ